QKQHEGEECGRRRFPGEKYGAMPAEELQQPRPTPGPGKNQLADGLVLAEPSIHAGEEHPREIKVEEVNQVEMPDGVHGRAETRSEDGSQCHNRIGFAKQSEPSVTDAACVGSLDS